MTTVTQILNQAKKWLGYSEANGKFKIILDVYNSHKPLARGYAIKLSDEWCDAFVSACAIACGAVDIIGTEVGVPRHVDIFKKNGIWLGRAKPQPGDVIVFDWDGNGSGDHIGYVYSVDGNYIITIEGNYNEEVAKRTITYNHPVILGYARPEYETSEKDDETSKDDKKTTNEVDVYYRVCTQKHKWLQEVKNLSDFAGWQNSPIVGVAMKVSKGYIKYRVHIKGGKWLSWVTGYNIKDFVNGYAGNGQVIDAIQIYYYTPKGMKLKEAVYKVNNYDWQHDTDKDSGQDGYAGLFGTAMIELRISINDC
jgi:CHAP domain.